MEMGLVFIIGYRFYDMVTMILLYYIDDDFKYILVRKI